MVPDWPLRGHVGVRAVPAVRPDGDVRIHQDIDQSPGGSAGMSQRLFTPNWQGYCGAEHHETG